MSITPIGDYSLLSSTSFYDQFNSLPEELQVEALTEIPPRELVKNLKKVWENPSEEAMEYLFFRLFEKKEIITLSDIQAFLSIYNSTLSVKDFIFNEPILLSFLRIRRLNLPRYITDGEQCRSILGVDFNYENPLLYRLLGKIRKLDLSITRINNQQFRSILEHCQNLRSLNIKWCHEITDLSPVLKLTKLNLLEVSGNDRRDDSVLSNLQNLIIRRPGE